MNKHALKSGVITGVIFIVVNLLLYIVDPTLFAKWWVGIVSIVLAVALISYFGIQYRNENGGFLTFGKAWVYSFVAFAISGLLGIIFQILLYTVIDPDLPSIIVDAQIENQEAMMSGFGIPEDQLEEAMEQAREGIEEGVTPVGMIKGYFFLLIFYAIGALISGAIIKKKEPEFE